MFVYSFNLFALVCCSQKIAVINSFFFPFIADPPEFVEPEVGASVLEGGNITLVCASRVNGNPTPTISWMDNNGTTVSDGTGISGSTTISLTITGVTRYQAGNWTYTAENYLGSNKAEVLSMFVQVRACTCSSTLSGKAPRAYASRSRIIRSEVKLTVAF